MWGMKTLEKRQSNACLFPFPSPETPNLAIVLLE
jgi:hypothetical protein